MTEVSKIGPSPQLLFFRCGPGAPLGDLRLSSLSNHNRFTPLQVLHLFCLAPIKTKQFVPRELAWVE